MLFTNSTNSKEIKMTSRERFLKVIKGEIPDRVPVTLFMVDQGHFLNQLYPGIDPLDYETLQLKVIEAQKQLGADVFVRQLFWVNDPLSIHMGGLDVSRETENWEVKNEIKTDNNSKITRSTIKTPAGTLTQEFTINEIRKGTFMYACTKKPVENMKDLEIAIKYEPGIPKDFREKVKTRVGKIKKALGNDGILGVWAPHGPFNNSSLLIKHDELYSLFITDYPFYEKLMTFAMERILDYTQAMIDAAPDVLCVGGNVPGGFLGTETYDNYILPFEKKYIDFCQKSGIPAMYHNCGQIMSLVDSYKKLGVKIVEPFSPPPLGDADIETVKKRVNGDYIILSGIDQVNVLQKGSVEQTKKVTAETMLKGKPGGKFIMQPVDFLEYGTPVENVETYIKTAVENAWY
jgi:uroporphyrinogen decarboxylase